MSSLTFGSHRSPVSFLSLTPSLTFSPTSEQSETIETDGSEMSHAVVPADRWHKQSPSTEPLSPNPAAVALSGGLKPCGMAAAVAAWPWAMPHQDANDCWTLSRLPWGQGAPSKTKWTSAPCLHIDTPEGTKFSCLTDDVGRRYVMGPCLGKGASGKFKLCLPVDSPLEAMCVKELRLPAPFAGPEVVAKKTIETSLRHMSFECSMSSQFGGPMAVHHAYAHGIRGYALFPLARGNLFDFARDVPDVFRAPLARVVGRSIGRTLRKMHRSGFLHLDVKEGNILVHHQAPYISLTDFGSTVPIYGTRTLGHYGYHSTYCAPEALTDGGFVARSSDMWSLGITLLTLLAPPRDYAAISYVPTPNGAFDVTASANNVGHLLGVVHNFWSSTNSIPSDVAQKLTSEMEPLHAWLLQCRSVDAALMQLITQTLLVPYHERASATAFLLLLQNLSTLPHAPDVDEAMAQYLSWSSLDLKRSAPYDALDQIRVSAHVYEYAEGWTSPDASDSPDVEACRMALC